MPQRHSYTIRVPEHINKQLQVYLTEQAAGETQNSALIKLLLKGLENNKLDKIDRIDQELHVIATSLEGMQNQSTNIIEYLGHLLTAIKQQIPETKQFKD